MMTKEVKARTDAYLSIASTAVVSAICQSREQLPDSIVDALHLIESALNDVQSKLRRLP